MADNINKQQGNWNRDGELWNEDNPANLSQLRPIKALPNEDASSGSPPRKLVYSDFIEGRDAPIIAEVEPELQREPLYGYYSAIRAARVAHQHRVGFWAFNGAIAPYTESQVPDPSAEEIDQAYEDLQLFSYLPAGMLPTRQEFDSLAKPQQRAAIVQDQLQNFGVKTGEGDSTQNLDDRVADVVPLLGSTTPFTSNLDGFCVQRTKELVNG